MDGPSNARTPRKGDVKLGDTVYLAAGVDDDDRYALLAKVVWVGLMAFVIGMFVSNGAFLLSDEGIAVSARLQRRLPCCVSLNASPPPLSLLSSRRHLPIPPRFWLAVHCTASMWTVCAPLSPFLSQTRRSPRFPLGKNRKRREPLPGTA